MRIVGGKYRHRNIIYPDDASHTRPTKDRVREAIFSALGDISNARVLDLYAGSGAQYAAFDAFSDGNTLLTVEFALCNWNQKTEYRACIVSASDGETTILNTYNFK